MANRITEANIKEIVNFGENKNFEFKAKVPQNLKNVGIIVSGFANCEGGSIIFGIADSNGAIIGINPYDIEILSQEFLKTKYNNLCHVYSLQVDKMTIAVVDVEKAQRLLYIDDNAYIRNNATIVKIDGSISSKSLKDFIHEIQFENRNPRNTAALKLLDDKKTNPTMILKKGSILYRSRIINDIKEIGTDKENGFYGFNKEKSFVPPPTSTRDLRANYRYIPYLYCSNNPYTALVEVRPRLDANISIARIRVNEDIILLDFSLNDASPKITEKKRKLFAEISMLFSKPVATEDDIIDYIPTQYIAEYAKYLGYDGISFRSSLTPECYTDNTIERYNVVIFKYNNCEAVSSNVFKVTRNFYEYEQVDEDTKMLSM